MGGYLSVFSSQTTSVPAPTPIALIGPTKLVVDRVALHLLPEYEVVVNLCSIAKAREELLAIRANNDSSPPLRHIVFGKGFPEQRMQQVRHALGGSDSGACWYWTPMKEGEKPPNAKSISEEQLEFFAEKISAHIKEVLSRNISEGRDGDGLVYTL